MFELESRVTVGRATFGLLRTRIEKGDSFMESTPYEYPADVLGVGLDMVDGKPVATEGDPPWTSITNPEAKDLHNPPDPRAGRALVRSYITGLNLEKFEIRDGEQAFRTIYAAMLELGRAAPR